MDTYLLNRLSWLGNQALCPSGMVSEGLRLRDESIQ